MTVFFFSEVLAEVSSTGPFALFSNDSRTSGQASVTEAIGFSRRVYQHTIVSRIDCREAFDEQRLAHTCELFGVGDGDERLP